MISDPIADMLTQIRNAQMRKHPTVVMPASRAKERLLSVLQEEGYIERVERIDNGDKKPELRVYLRYANDSSAAVREIKRISRPGRRCYLAASDVPVYRSGLGTVVVSTSKGMMTGEQARKLKIGGELICSVY